MSEATKVPKEDLDNLWMSLADFGGNRNPWRVAEHISLWKDRIKEKIEEQKNARNTFLQPMLPAGMNIADIKNDVELQIAVGSKLWREAQEEVKKAGKEEVEIVFSGAPIDLRRALKPEMLDALVMMDDSIKLLKKYGLIITGDLA